MLERCIRAPGHDPTRRFLPLALSGATFAPLVVAAIEECRSVAARAYPTSDLAVLEDGVLHAGKQLVGPYSQFGFQHPGPMLFWVLWPAHALSGGRTLSLHLAAIFLNAVCLAFLLRTAFHAPPGRAPHGLARDVLGVAMLAILVRHFSGFVSEAVPSAHPSAFADIWNPVITILPFAALCGACVGVAGGRAAAIVPATVLHAFVCQTHVGYVPVATGLLICALAWARTADEGSARPRRARWLLVASGVMVACWAPPLVDSLAGTGNAGRILHFFLSHRPRPGLGAALAYGARQLQAPLIYAVRLLDPLEVGTHTALSAGLSLVEVALLLASALRARGERPVVGRMAVLGLVGTALAFVSAKSVDVELPVYPTAWFGVVGLLGWLAVLAGFCKGRATADAARSRPLLERGAIVVCSVVAVAIGAEESVRTVRAYTEFRVEAAHEADTVPTLAAAAERVARSRGTPPVVTVGQHDDWELLAGVVLELDKRGTPPRLDPEWRFMFGAGHDYAVPDADALIVSTSPIPGRRALAAHDASGLYAMGPERAGSAAARPLSRELWIVDSGGIVGDPTTLLDDRTPPEGVPWDDPDAVQLTGTESWITVGSNGALFESAIVLADANDEYALETSTDGRHFRELARVPAAPGFGLRWRRLTLVRSRAAPLVRVRPLSGDGFYSVAALGLNATRWGGAVIGAAGVAGDPDAAADGLVPPAGVPWTAETAVSLPAAESSLTVLLPVVPSGSVELAIAGPARYEVEGSTDCAGFSSGGIVEWSVPGPGARAFAFDDHPTWRCLRFAPLPPLGAHAIGEITPNVLPQVTVVDLGTPGARAHLIEGWSGDEHDGFRSWVWAVAPRATVEVSLRKESAYDLVFDAAPHLVRGRAQKLSVSLNGTELGAFELSSGTNELQVAVPRGLGADESRLAFDFGDAVSPLSLGESDDARPLAASFDRIAFIPIDETDGN